MKTGVPVEKLKFLAQTRELNQGIVFTFVLSVLNRVYHFGRV